RYYAGPSNVAARAFATMSAARVCRASIRTSFGSTAAPASPARVAEPPSPACVWPAAQRIIALVVRGVEPQSHRGTEKTGGQEENKQSRYLLLRGQAAFSVTFYPVVFLPSLCLCVSVVQAVCPTVPSN